MSGHAPARRFGVCVMVALLSGALLLGAWPADAVPAETADVPVADQSWSVTEELDEQGNPRWRVTWRPAAPLSARAARGFITSDDRIVGVAVESPDLRSVSATTTDPRLVLNRPTFALTYGAGPVEEPPGDGLRRATGSPARPPRPPLLDVDPGARGRFEVRRASYDLGDQALSLRGLHQPVELAGEVTWPKGASGRRPVVMFLHGRHETCYKAGGDGLTNEWPCRRGWRPVPSHAGYRYAADVLASHGHVVISVAANGVNAFDYAAADAGAKMRGRLVLTHLRTWRRWNRDTGGPFGSRFVRRLDLGNVGLMGHSRGGEGVVQAALLNHQLGDPFGIRAVMPLAPTNFQRLTLPGMPLAVVLPYCDGDVQDLQGQRFYDDARLSTGGRQPSLAVLTVMGANHNFFNTEWTPGFAAAPAMDDWAGFSAGIYRDGPDGGGGGQNRSNKVCNPAQPRRLTAGEQQAAGAAYIAGFFRLHLGREVALLGLLDGSGQRARSAGRAKVHVVAQSPRRRDLDRFSDPGRRRTVKGLHARICSGRSHAFGLMERLPACDDDLVGTQVPHWDESMNAPATPGVRMLEVSWSRPGGRVHVPLGRAQRDLSSMHAVTFRAAADPDGVPADMLVRLVDGSGRRRAVRVSDHSTALNPAPGNRPPLPHALPRQVHIPLSRFKGINLRRVASVTFVAASDQGRIWLADLAAQRPAIGAASLPAMPTLSIDNVRMKEGDLRPRLARFTVTASERARRPIRFHLQANRMFGDGSEGTELLPTRHRTWLTIPAGSRRAVFDYPVKANTVDDDDLLLTVTMTRTRNASLRRQSGRGLIADDDPTPTLTLEDGVAAESDGQLRFRMTLSEPSGRPVYTYLLVESGTAVAGEDFADVFAVDGEVRPGRTRGWITLPLIDDDVPEDTEDMYLRQGLYEIAGAGTVELTGTIHDDD